ncbi:sensor histidine kinase [Herbidospora sp. NEAU-GS84]|uniref:histidine kinase n=1 Tax=Herbidospora solisilvae TaxID=2696284 RepID=A0A7C9JQ95_9ACTN|nr:histidine kinase [Herbidospora solisilvae]NAS20519.1 sensor histidine kinase [Herbidospora solisilvae]
MSRVAAVLVAVAGLAEVLGRPEAVGDPVPLALGALAAGALVWFRTRFPAALLVALVAVGAVSAGGAYYPFWHLYATLVLVHTIGWAYELRSRAGLLGLAAVVAAWAHLQTRLWTDPPEVLISAIFYVAAYTTGVALRRQIDRTRIMAERAVRLELEREYAVRQERARIARELHDVVAHNVSLMTLHTGGVRRLLGPAFPREVELLHGVERAGREAIEELRLMLGMLREPGEPSPPGTLEDLVAAAGPGVGLTTVGEPRPLPPGAGLSVYRIVQEALTNVRKHARATRAEVTLTYAPGSVTVTITDDGTGGGADDAAGTGHGLIGMRERVAMHGGILTAGPTATGYRVTAVLPTG